MSGAGMPRLGVHAGTSDYVDGGMVFHPGDIFMHPYSLDQPGADGKSRGVLTFTVPRNGFYTIRAVFRTLDANTIDNSHTTDTTVPRRCGAGDGAGTFCGLQVEGESFAEECRGHLLLVR